MARAVIDGGICGYQTEVVVTSPDGMTVQLATTSDCPNVQRLMVEMDGQSLDGWREVMRPRGDAHELSPLQAAFHEFIPHPGCPVYSGIIKAIEVTLGTALPADARIQVKRD